jgi:hypothetical protein
MKRYVMIILIALHLMGGSVYAKMASLEHVHIDTNIHECMEHEHNHYHGGLIHKHGHSHTVPTFLDFHTGFQDGYAFNILISKSLYLEVTSYIVNPIPDSLFRPPKI